MTDEERAVAEAAAKAEADAKAAADAAEAERIAKDKADAEAAAAKTDAEKAADARAAELQAEIDRLQGIADQFAGVDPEKAKKALADAEANEAARVQAEKDKAKAEGNFERLREIQEAETAAKIKAAEDRAEAAAKDAETARAALNSSRIETAFANSKFLQDETILSGPKAQRLFGDYVEIEDGQVVVYDAPADATKRAKIMDNKGNALPFNDAIAKVINADADKDTLLKSKVKPGAGSTTTEGKSKPDTGDRHAKLKTGLAKLRGK